MINCPFCASQIQEALSTCPYCNENLLLHGQPAPAPPAKPETRFCPYCAETIPAADRPCPYCGLGAAPAAPEMRPCPYCAESIPTADRACRYCGSDVTIGPAVTDRRPCPFCNEPIAFTDRQCRYCGNDTAAPRPSAAANTFIEWEQPGRNIFARWWTTWAGSQFGMERFWSRTPYTGGFGPPTKFGLFFFVQTVPLLAMCYSPLVILPMIAASSSRGGSDMSAGTAIGIILGAIVVAIPVGLLFGLVALYTTAGVYHVCVLMLGGRGEFEKTFRAVTYSYGSAFWNIACCFVVPIVFQTMALTHAFAHGHGMSKGRACAAALIPQLLSLLAIAAPYIYMLVMAAMRGR